MPGFSGANIKKHQIGALKITIKTGNLSRDNATVLVNAASISPLEVGSWAGVAGALRELVQNDPKNAQILSDDWEALGKKINVGTASFVKDSGKPVQFKASGKSFYVMHAGSPIASNGNLDAQNTQKLEDAYFNILKNIQDFNTQNPDKIIQSVAIPPLGIGIYDVKPEVSAACAAKAIEKFNQQYPAAALDIRIPLYDGDKPNSKDNKFGEALVGALGKLQQQKKMEQLAQEPNTDKIVLYCAAQKGKSSSTRLAIKFTSEAAKENFKIALEKAASANGVNLPSNFFSQLRANPTVLYIEPSNPSAGKQFGAYVAAGGELSVNFGNQGLRDAFAKLTGIKSEHATMPGANAKGKGALYFNKDLLPATPDPTQQKNIQTTVPILPLSPAPAALQASAQPGPEQMPSSPAPNLSANQLIQRVGTFATYKGMDGGEIFGNALQGALAKQMLAQLNPASGWSNSAITKLQTPLAQQEDGMVVINAEQLAMEKATPQGFKESYQSAFGSTTVSISKSTLKKLSDSARIMTNSNMVPKELFQRIQLELVNQIKTQEKRSLKQILEAKGGAALSEKWLSEWKQLGFKSKGDCQRTLDTPLILLASNICHSQEVHFFVEQHKSADGKALNKLRNGNLDNQTPCVVLSIPGINIAYSGLPVQVSASGEVTVGPLSAKQLIKNMWESALDSAALQDCRNITMPAIGLGAFAGANGKQIAPIYFDVLFELLSSEKYKGKFDNVLFNPTPAYNAQFNQVLQRYQGKFGNCNVRNFQGDVKMLAVEFAKNGQKCALLNPSDADVVLGKYDVGEYYKSGNYVGEEDIGATSTAALGSRGISDVYTNSQKILSTVSQTPVALTAGPETTPVSKPVSPIVPPPSPPGPPGPPSATASTSQPTAERPKPPATPEQLLAEIAARKERREQAASASPVQPRQPQVSSIDNSPYSASAFQGMVDKARAQGAEEGGMKGAIRVILNDNNTHQKLNKGGTITPQEAKEYLILIAETAGNMMVLEGEDKRLKALLVSDPQKVVALAKLAHKNLNAEANKAPEIFNPGVSSSHATRVGQAQPRQPHVTSTDNSLYSASTFQGMVDKARAQGVEEGRMKGAIRGILNSNNTHQKLNQGGTITPQEAKVYLMSIAEIAAKDMRELEGEDKRLKALLVSDPQKVVALAKFAHKNLNAEANKAPEIFNPGVSSSHVTRLTSLENSFSQSRQGNNNDTSKPLSFKGGREKSKTTLKSDHPVVKTKDPKSPQDFKKLVDEVIKEMKLKKEGVDYTRTATSFEAPSKDVKMQHSVDGCVCTELPSEITKLKEVFPAILKAHKNAKMFDFELNGPKENVEFMADTCLKQKPPIKPNVSKEYLLEHGYKNSEAFIQARVNALKGTPDVEKNKTENPRKPPR